MTHPNDADRACASSEAGTEQVAATSMPTWETPTLEDVSEQVMAQPYIRFT